MKNFFGIKDIKAARKRLDQLMQEEDRMVAAQTLGLVDSEQTPLACNLPPIEYSQGGKASTDGIRKVLGTFLCAIRASLLSDRALDQMTSATDKLKRRSSPNFGISACKC